VPGGDTCRALARMDSTSLPTASSPRPVSSNRSPSKPPVCESNCRTVTASVAAGSGTANSGR
jgi:hypothetical protein